MEFRAPAKINLTLEVLGRRGDGYHEVRTVLQAVDLFDTLRFSPSEKLELHCSDPRLSGGGNLVWKAAEALSELTGREIPVSIVLEKAIPEGMGLGGGSSDAATTLMAINLMLDLGYMPEQLEEIAASLGSDVPFFIRGGAALGTGRGEKLEVIDDAAEGAYVLLCPDLTPEGPSKTARLYSLLTADRYTDGSRTARMLEALSLGQPLEPLLFNVFDTIADNAFPGLGEIRAEFSRISGAQVHLSGSGPALYCMAQGPFGGERVVNALKRAGHRSYLVASVLSSQVKPASQVKPGRCGVT